MNTPGLVVYTIANDGRLYASRTDLAGCTNNALIPGGFAPSGFPVAVQTGTGTDDVFLSGSGKVVKVQVTYNAGATCAITFNTAPAGWTSPTVASPSALMTSDATPYFLYVGSSDGHLYKINPTTGANAANRLVRAGATIGDPSYDSATQKFYVGDSTGRIYSFDLF